MNPVTFESEQLNIREAGNADSCNIRQLVFEVLSEYGLQPDPAATDKDLDDLQANYADNGGYFGVVEEQGRVVASVGIFKIDTSRCELRKMYVLPSYRGRGLGKQLLQFSLDKARALGFAKMTLETATPLVEAIALYEKYGFTEIQAQHLSPRCDQAFELTIK